METNTSITEKDKGASQATAGGGTKGGSVPAAAGGQLEGESIEFFVSFVQVFGLPRSIGQIYGLLFVSVGPLPMDEIVARLGISKGSASQGLSVLKSLGAVESEFFPPDRREHFRADFNVSRIVTHFFDNRLSPILQDGAGQINAMRIAARAEGLADGIDESDNTVLPRIDALLKWHARGRSILPLVAAWLKR